MEDVVIFSIFAAGGFLVLLSYFLLYKYGVLKQVMPVIRNEKQFTVLWAISVFFTVVSIFAVIIYFSFYKKLEDWQRTLFIVSLSVFLFFAICWSISLYYIYKKGADFRAQQIILLFVALGTAGMLSSVIDEDTPWLIITAAFIVFFHHFFIDALLWVDVSKKYYLDQKKPKKIKRK